MPSFFECPALQIDVGIGNHQLLHSWTATHHRQNCTPHRTLKRPRGDAVACQKHSQLHRIVTPAARGHDRLRWSANLAAATFSLLYRLAQQAGSTSWLTKRPQMLTPVERKLTLLSKSTAFSSACTLWQSDTLPRLRLQQSAVINPNSFQADRTFSVKSDVDSVA